MCILHSLPLYMHMIYFCCDFPHIDCFSITLNTWMQQYLGRLPSSSDDDDDDSTSGAQIEELPSEPVNTFREDGKCVCMTYGICVEQ